MLIIDIFLTHQDESIFKDIGIAILGGAITFAGLIYTFRHETDKEKERQKNQQLDKLIYLSTTVVQAETHIKAQVNNFREFIEQIEKDFSQFPKLKLSPSLSVTRIAEKIEQSEYYHAYLDQTQDEQEADKILMFFEYTDFFHGVFNDIHEERRRLFRNNSEYRIEFEKALKNVIKETLTMSDNKTFASHYVKVADIYNDYKWQAVGHSRNITFHMSFLEDIHEMIVNSPHGVINEAKIVVLLIKDALHIYNGILNNAEMTRDQFKAYADVLDEELVEFQKYTIGIKKYYTIKVLNRKFGKQLKSV